MKRWLVGVVCAMGLVCPVSGLEPDDQPVEPEPLPLDPGDFDELPPEIMEELLRQFDGGGVEPAETDEGMEDEARLVLHRCFDVTDRDQIEEVVGEAYWEYYHRYVNFEADPTIERLVIESLLGDPAFRRGSVARSAAIVLLELCDAPGEEDQEPFPTALVVLLGEEFARMDDYEVSSMFSTFTRRLQPADRMLWYGIPKARLRADDAYVAWGSLDLFMALGVLGGEERAYLRGVVADPVANDPDLWRQLNEPIAVRQQLEYAMWDRTLFRAQAVATLLLTSSDPADTIAFLSSLKGRAKIDAGRGIVDALWDQAGWEIDMGSSPFGNERWTDERFAALFDVLDAMLLDPRARLIVGADFEESDWGGWYYDSVVGDLVDLHDSPNATVAERSVAIARLAAQMHAGDEAMATVDRWIEEERSGREEMFDFGEFVAP